MGRAACHTAYVIRDLSLDFRLVPIDRLYINRLSGSLFELQHLRWEQIRTDSCGVVDAFSKSPHDIWAIIVPIHIYRMPRYQIPVTWLNCLAYAGHHYPLHTPKRWTLVQEFLLAKVASQESRPDHLMVTLGCGKRTVLFECKASHCREVYFMLPRYAPCFAHEDLDKFAIAFFKNSAKGSPHKSIVLQPKDNLCPLCRQTIETDHRPSFPQVFTKTGVVTAVSFHGRCKPCKVSKMHSFHTKDGQVGVPASKVFHLWDVQDYFMVSRETVFQVTLLEQFHAALTISGCSFGTIVDAYNAEHKPCAVNVCVPGHTCTHQSGPGATLLHRDRMEDAWFIWRLLLQKRNNEPLEVSQQTYGHRPELEDLCRKAYDQLLCQENHWALHQCSVKGCQEGYITIDGNAKLRRAVCAAPKSAIQMGPDMPKVFNACPNSPVMGCQNRVPSKLCKDHQVYEDQGPPEGHSTPEGKKSKRSAPLGQLTSKGKKKTVTGRNMIMSNPSTTCQGVLEGRSTPEQKTSKSSAQQCLLTSKEKKMTATGRNIMSDLSTTSPGASYGVNKILTISLWDMKCKTSLHAKSTIQLPLPEDSSTMTGCKEEQKLTKFYDTTAGILAFVKPCGVIVKLLEMYTCESSSQVFSALLSLFQEYPGVYKFIGYDRACELHPFLCRLAEKGNPGACLLLDNCDFLVDIFHVTKHVKETCMPLEGAKCRYHPHLERFSAIHGTNTESAEQAFSWLNRFKLLVRKMTVHKFKWLLQEAIHARNTHITTKKNLSNNC